MLHRYLHRGRLHLVRIPFAVRILIIKASAIGIFKPADRILHRLGERLPQILPHLGAVPFLGEPLRHDVAHRRKKRRSRGLCENLILLLRKLREPRRLIPVDRMEQVQFLMLVTLPVLLLHRQIPAAPILLRHLEGTVLRDAGNGGQRIHIRRHRLINGRGGQPLENLLIHRADFRRIPGGGRLRPRGLLPSFGKLRLRSTPGCLRPLLPVQLEQRGKAAVFLLETGGLRQKQLDILDAKLAQGRLEINCILICKGRRLGKQNPVDHIVDDIHHNGSLIRHGILHRYGGHAGLLLLGLRRGIERKEKLFRRDVRAEQLIVPDDTLREPIGLRNKRPDAVKLYRFP